MPAPLVKYAFFFPFDIFCFFIKDQVFKDVWIDIRVFYSVPLVLLSVLMQISDGFQYCSSVVEFEVRYCDAFRSFLFVCKNQVFKVVWINIWVFDSVPFGPLVCFYAITRLFSVL